MEEKTIMELQQDYTDNIFENYQIEDKVKKILKEIFPHENNHSFWISMDSSMPRSVTIKNVHYNFKETFQYKLFVDTSFPCYKGICSNELLEHNKKQQEKKKELLKTAQKLYELFIGKELKAEDTNLKF